MNIEELPARFTAGLPDLLADIARLVRVESPSADPDAVAASAREVAELGTALLGAAPEVLTAGPHTHLRWRFGAGPARVLLLAHHDTVWPIGTLERLPYSVRDGVMRGPGCSDMKAGLVLGLHALAALGVPDGVTLLVTGDEELGSPSSQGLIERAAAGCQAALVLEGTGGPGTVKVVRKGVSRYTVEVTGRAAHAGVEPELGVNATVELAHQVLAVAALNDPANGTTVTPTLLAAGTSGNTVPAAGEFAVDVRVAEPAEQARVEAGMRALAPVLPGAQVRVVAGPSRPPLPSSASEALFARAATLADRMGLTQLSGIAVGGGSDGNFTAGVGVPTLDGLGACGGGPHSDTEHVLVSELPARAALVAALVHDLLAE